MHETRVVRPRCTYRHALLTYNYALFGEFTRALRLLLLPAISRFPRPGLWLHAGE